MKNTVLRIGALLLLLGGAVFFVSGCRAMADPYGSDIPNDPQKWELQGPMGGMMH